MLITILMVVGALVVVFVTGLSWLRVAELSAVECAPMKLLGALGGALVWTGILLFVAGVFVGSMWNSA